MKIPENPLLGPPPAEVPLTDTPLVRVIVQVRFGQILSINHGEFIAPFQEAIRTQYPVLRPETAVMTLPRPRGTVEAKTATVWRFFDPSQVWRASLACDFLALETTRYTSRDDFIRRFEELLEALERYIEPQLVDRLGVRYIDRVTGASLQDLPSLVRRELAGVLASPLAVHARQALCESKFELPDENGQLSVRWGLVPAHATVDPSAIEPIDQASWILDIDAFVDTSIPLDVEDVAARARALTERTYAFFRWAVTPAFLERYGGEP